MIQEVGTLLQQNGFGTKGTNLFGSEMPDAPDDAVAVYQYAGQAPTQVQEGNAILNPGLQVMVRDTKYFEAETKINSIFNLLSSFRGVIDGKEFLGFRPQQSPFPLGIDAKHRHQLAVNFIVSVKV